MNITLEVLLRRNACFEAKLAFADTFYTAAVPWQEVIAHPNCTRCWAVWIKVLVAQYGSAEDRAALRDDENSTVRWTVAKYGNAEDRAALMGDENRLVRICALHK
jgi:hypothetical protein